MEGKNGNYESIREKLKKLLALAESGVGGERENARRMFEDLCRKYGVEAEELADEQQEKEWVFEVGAGKFWKDLFVQCYCMVTGRRSMVHHQASRCKVAVSLTALQYAELRGLFEWHKANAELEMKQMKETLLIAYCRKHGLFSRRKEENEMPAELTAEEMKMLLRAMRMEEALSDRRYCKMINDE